MPWAIDGSAGRAGAGFGCKCGSGCGISGWLRPRVASLVGGSGRGVSVVGEAVVVGVPVGAGDGVAGCADGGGDS